MIKTMRAASITSVADHPMGADHLHLNRRLSQWLAIRPEGHVAVTPGKVELGQGILTALAQIAAEELDVALERIRLRPAATPDSPDEALTSGSLSVHVSGGSLRHDCVDSRLIFIVVCGQWCGVTPE